MLTKSHIKYITTDEKNAFPSSKLRAAKLEATSWSGYFTATYWKKKKTNTTFLLKIHPRAKNVILDCHSK